MEGAFSWLGQLAEWLGRFVPRVVIVQDNQALLAYVRGRRGVVTGPRLAVFWPFWTEASTYYVNEQLLTLTPQVLETSDGKTIVVQAVVTFRIVDVEKFGAEVYEAEESLGEALGEAVQGTVLACTWEQLQGGRAAIRNKLQDLASKATERFGVAIHKVRINSMARCRVLALYQASFAPDRAQGARPV